MVSLEAFIMDSVLEVAYGIGGRCVTCPFSHSASVSSDVGLESTGDADRAVSPKLSA
jgi:hypothetical protein